MRQRRLTTILLLLGVLLTYASQSIPRAESAAAATTSVPRPAHTVVVVLENKNGASVIGSGQAPYLNALAAQGATMTQSYGVTHPSQGNYIALFSGSPHGVTSDACPQSFPTTANLGSQLRAAGLSFAGYSESMPSAGYTGCSSGLYQRKHNPWVNFGNLPASTNQTFGAFPTDFAKLPTVAFVTPNLCNDMHDCSVATGDAWLKYHLSAYAQWARTHNSLLVVTFDENEGGITSPIPTVLVGQRVRPGRYAERMNHYNLLRTLENAYGLAPLGNATAAPPLSTIWTPVTSVGGVTNGGFERGLSGWTSIGRTGAVPTRPHSGLWAASAGAPVATTGDSILSQRFSVPAGKSKLTLWWRDNCRDIVSKAWATIVVKDNTSGTVSTPLPRTCTATATWRPVSLGVTAGHSYSVRMVNHDDGVAATPSQTYFDDIALS